MNIEDIAIVSGKADFDYEPVRRLEAKCEASNALMPAPTIAEVNGRLRALAAKVGADAIVEVAYDSGISFTSWKSLKGSGLAVKRIADERPCPFCAETIKRAAVKCRHCGSEVPAAEVRSEPAAIAPRVFNQEPLRDNNNPAIVIGIIVVVVMVVSMIIAGAGG